LIAFEMARQLQQAGEQVERVFLLDTATPQAVPRSWRENVTRNLVERLRQERTGRSAIAALPAMAALVLRKIGRFVRFEAGQLAQRATVAARLALTRWVVARGAAWPRAIRPLDFRTLYLAAENAYRPTATAALPTVLLRATSGHGNDVPFRHVYEDPTFGWGAVPALRHLDLDLPAGHRLGVTGASGSGKSTLAAVLTRLLDPAAGSMTLGGVDAAAVPGDGWRRAVALVGEHDHVFATTLRENLRFAAPTATDADLVAVLQRVRLGDWFAGLPDGLDTWLDGGRISGGERRRLAAARALLVDPAVLVLDEPTEGLDPATARALVADLVDGAAGRTVVLLAHRGEGLDLVDDVAHLEDGVLRALVQAKSPAA